MLHAAAKVMLVGEHIQNQKAYQIFGKEQAADLIAPILMHSTV